MHRVKRAAGIVLVLLLIATVGPGPAAGGTTNDRRGGNARGQTVRHEPAAAGGRAAAEGEEEGEAGPAEPDAWFIIQRSFPRRTIARNAFRRAAVQARQIRRLTAQQAPGDRARKWSLVGPTNIGGRVVDIAVDPDSPNTIFAAAATGGVWKSTDAGVTFETAWPDRLSQSMGALVMGPDGTLYAGTGEANPGGGSITFGGTGLYRSTDGGEHWTGLGLQSTGRIGRIVVDPQDPERIFVAAAGSLFNPGGQRGLYRSEDGGETWQRVLGAINSVTGAVDVAMDPQKPNRLLATTWDHLRQPDLRVYGGVGSGFYRSTDGGDTWTRLGRGRGLPRSSEGLGRMGVAIAPTDSDKAYAIAINTNGLFRGFFVSSNAGRSWTQLPDDPELAESQATYGWWFGRVWVDPDDADHVFVAGVPLMESHDGGRTWTASEEQFHVDQHAMTWDPNNAQRVYLGNDGGVYRSDYDGALSQPWVSAEREPFTQFYGLDVSRQDPTRISGGTQDNGSLRSWGGPDWNEYYFGDGEKNLINPKDQDVVFACLQYGFCARSTDGGNTMVEFFEETESDRRNWFTPMEFDPNRPRIMYYGGNLLNRSTNKGRTWETISPDLTDGPARDPIYPFGTITTIAPSKSNGDVIYVGTDDAKLWTTRDLGATWTELEDPDLPIRWVTRIAVHPLKSKVAYATFSGFRSGDQSAHVTKTSDGGKTWSNVSSNLPEAPVNDIVINPKRRKTLFLATDVGVFVSRNAGKSWFSHGSDLPLAPVTDLRYHARSKTLYASTFGRSIFKLPPAG